MSQSPQVPPEEFIESMREEVDAYLKQIMEAVNEAPDGEWIAGSEEQVRDLVAAMRQHVFERAVQKRAVLVETGRTDRGTVQDRHRVAYAGAGHAVRRP